MGHNTKTMNRQAAVNDARSKVLKVAKTVENLTQTLIDEDKERIKRFEKMEQRVTLLEGVAANTGRDVDVLRECHLALSAAIEYLQLPFWKRWVIRFNTWRARP